jgi:Zn-finger nucleic acid-binding protein
VTYRDRLLSCPRCGATLERTTRHETWPCPACGGVAVELGELIRLLLRYAPELLPPGSNRLATKPRATVSLPLRCAACTKPMQPVELHGVALDRCPHDELLWFEANQLDVVIDAAIADVEARRSWAQRLRDLLFAN